VQKYIRQNILGLVAIFLSLTAGAYAVTLAPPDSVVSSSIKNGEVKKPDLGNSAVTNSKLAANAVDSARVVDNSLTGQDINESSLILDVPTPPAPKVSAIDPADIALTSSYQAVNTVNVTVPNSMTLVATSDNVLAVASGGVVKCRISHTDTLGLFGNDAAPLEVIVGNTATAPVDFTLPATGGFLAAYAPNDPWRVSVECKSATSGSSWSRGTLAVWGTGS